MSLATENENSNTHFTLPVEILPIILQHIPFYSMIPEFSNLSKDISLPIESLQMILREYVPFYCKITIPEFSNLLEDRESWSTEDKFQFYSHWKDFKPGFYLGIWSAFLVEFDKGEICFKLIMKKKKYTDIPNIRKLARNIYEWNKPCQVKFKRSIPEMINFLTTFSNNYKLFDRKTMQIYDFGETYVFVDFEESVLYWLDGTRHVLKEDKQLEIDNNGHPIRLTVKPDSSIRVDKENGGFDIIKPADVNSIIQIEPLFESRCRLARNDSLVSVTYQYQDREVLWCFTWSYDNEMFQIPMRRRNEGYADLFFELEKADPSNRYPEELNFDHYPEI